MYVSCTDHAISCACWCTSIAVKPGDVLITLNDSFIRMSHKRTSPLILKQTRNGSHQRLTWPTTGHSPWTTELPISIQRCLVLPAPSYSSCSWNCGAPNKIKDNGWWPCLRRCDSSPLERPSQFVTNVQCVVHFCFQATLKNLSL